MSLINPGKAYLLLSLFVLLGVAACSDNEPQLEDVKYYKIDFADITLPVPITLKPTNLHHFLLAIEKADSISEKDTGHYARVSKSFSGVRYSIFFDTLSPYDHLMIREMEYLVMDSYNTGILLSIIDKEIKEFWTGHNVYTERQNNELMHGTAAQIFKVKYLLFKDGIENYIHYYLVTSKSKTFLLSARSTSEADLDYLVSKIKYAK